MKSGLIAIAASLLLLGGCSSSGATSAMDSPPATVEALATVFVPDVSGLNGEEAASLLSARGLNFIFLVNGASVPPSASQSVVSQDITPGFEVAAAAIITVVAMEPSAPPAPEPAPAPVPEPIPEPAPVEPIPVEPVPTPAEPAPLPPYENCDEVRANDDAPIYPDNPRWSPKFDADHDGVGCDKPV